MKGNSAEISVQIWHRGSTPPIIYNLHVANSAYTSTFSILEKIFYLAVEHLRKAENCIILQIVTRY
ncbi:MAG: hypothetical protein AYK18_15240 [Theionarchaea archaeon DG-70]|nr:MAG: hypothetical protein AYK18_15240 [Theionarchaea archaeon DG-70]